MTRTESARRSHPTYAIAARHKPYSRTLSYNLIGLSLQDDPNYDMGGIKYLAIEHGARVYIVLVSDFLGMGEYYVAVGPATVSLTYSAPIVSGRV